MGDKTGISQNLATILDSKQKTPLNIERGLFLWDARYWALRLAASVSATSVSYARLGALDQFTPS